MNNVRTARIRVRGAGHWFGWIALALLLFLILTGYGITAFRIVTPLTLGLVNKGFAQSWHEWIDVALLPALAVHVAIAVWWRVSGSRKKEAGDG
jgi:hypothetical protein